MWPAEDWATLDRALNEFVSSGNPEVRETANGSPNLPPSSAR